MPLKSIDGIPLLTLRNSFENIASPKRGGKAIQKLNFSPYIITHPLTHAGRKQQITIKLLGNSPGRCAFCGTSEARLPALSLESITSHRSGILNISPTSP
jgi:hypothetical protein